jgi:outer membrane protein
MMKRMLIKVALLSLVLQSAPLQAQEKVALHLTLDQAEKISVKNNPKLTTSLLNAAAALQVQRQYRSAYFPTLSGNVTGAAAEPGSRIAAGGLNNPSVYNRFATGLFGSQMVTDFGRTGNLVDMAKLRADAQQEGAQQTRADILLLTGQAYFSLLRGEAVLKVAQQTVTARELLSDQVTALAQSKLKSQLDVSFANVNLADARLLLVQAENDLHAAEAQLSAVMALPDDTSFVLAEEPMPPPLPAQLEPLIQEALQQRPELKGLHLEQSAASKFTAAEHALNYPNISIQAGAGVIPAGQSQFTDHYAAIGINLNIPIFNGGLFTAREREAALRAQAVTENLSDKEIEIARDTRVACLDQRSACDRVLLSEQLLENAQTAQELAQSRYTLGLSSIIELSQAQLNLTSAQITAKSARYECQAKRLKVEFQLGALK